MWSHATQIKSADVKRSAQEEVVTVKRQPSRIVVFRTRSYSADLDSHRIQIMRIHESYHIPHFVLVCTKYRFLLNIR